MAIRCSSSSPGPAPMATVHVALRDLGADVLPTVTPRGGPTGVGH